MTRVPSLEALWETAPPAAQTFRRSHVAGLPDAARRYLEHSIAPGVHLASAVRLRMHGEIKLKRWFPFTAEQVIRWDRGMIWRATVRMHGVPIRGFDRLLDGEGAMEWRLLGLVPIMRASGPDITKSASGRMAAETVWLPSVLCREEVTWTAQDESHAQAHFTAGSEQVEVELVIKGGGRLESVRLKRWGNPEGAAYHYADFGGIAEQEATFDGYTIPTRLRIGWHFGTERFEAEGEFFRGEIDRAEFR